MSAPGFYHEALTGAPTPPRTQRRRVAHTLAWLVGLGLAAAGLVYAVVRVVARTTETLTSLDVHGFPWVPVLLIGALLGLRVAFKAGQYHRGYMHARGIRRSHWSAIRGEKH